MSDYRDNTPLVFGPPAKEAKGDGVPMYPEKFPELVSNGITGSGRAVLAGLYKAYHSGKDAKAKGLMRVSPFYERPYFDCLFFAGYDGLNEREATAKFKEMEL